MQLPEQISALMDDAADDAPANLLAQVASEPELAERWARYHLIGEVLRDRSVQPLDHRLTRGVASALEREPPLLAPTAQRPPRLQDRATKPTFGYALAASLAGIAAMGLYAFKAGPASGPELATVIAPLTEPSAAPGVAVTSQPLAEGEYQRRLNSYLVNFNEARAQVGVPGVHPYVRVISFEPARAR